MSRRVLQNCSVLSLALALLVMPTGFASAQPQPGGDGLPPPPPGFEDPDGDLPDDSEDFAPDEDLGITEDSILEGMLNRFPCEVLARNNGKKLFSNIKRARSYFNKFARIAGLERDAIDWDYIREEAQSYLEFCREGGDEEDEIDSDDQD